jgi:hypothetical protein
MGAMIQSSMTQDIDTSKTPERVAQAAVGAGDRPIAEQGSCTR